MPDTGARGPVLRREIGLFGATALGIGAIIGSGIFIVTGIVAGVAGPAMIFSVLIAGVIAVFSAMSVAELGACLPEEGGTYAYAQKLISPFAGFIAGSDLGLLQHLCRGGSLAGFCPLFCHAVSRGPGKNYRRCDMCFFLLLSITSGSKNRCSSTTSLSPQKSSSSCSSWRSGWDFSARVTSPPLFRKERWGSSAVRPLSFLPTPGLPGSPSWPRKCTTRKRTSPAPSILRSESRPSSTCS